MSTTQIAARIMTFLLFLATLFACADLTVFLSAEMYAETTDSMPFDPTGSYTGHQPPLFLTESYDNPQILQLYSTEKREFAGRRYGVHIELLDGQDLSFTMHHLYAATVHTTASGKGHLSVLGLSLGGNAPPVYHV